MFVYFSVKYSTSIHTVQTNISRANCYFLRPILKIEYLPGNIPLTPTSHSFKGKFWSNYLCCEKKCWGGGGRGGWTLLMLCVYCLDLTLQKNWAPPVPTPMN